MDIAIMIAAFGSRMQRTDAKRTKGDAAFRIFRAVSRISWSEFLLPPKGYIHDK
jgi:hypothetical protein